MLSCNSSWKKSFNLLLEPKFLTKLGSKLFSQRHERLEHKFHSSRYSLEQSMGKCSVVMSVNSLINIFSVQGWIWSKMYKKNCLFTFFLHCECSFNTFLHRRWTHTLDLHNNTRYDEFKKSRMLSNWPKWLFVTQSVLFGNQAIEIRSFDS